MENSKIRVALTHGDTNGIGYELIFKTFAEPEILELCTPVIYGSPKVAAYHRNALDIPAQFSIINDISEVKDGRVNLLTTYDEETKVELGTPSEESGQAALKALDRAMSDFRDGGFDILVNAPVAPDNIKIEGYPFHSITSYIQTCVGEGKKAMPIWVCDQLRVASVTGELPLNSVAPMITKEAVKKSAGTLLGVLRRDFNISNPRIAILALNPVAQGEGKYGKEENEAIIPAIQELAEENMEAFGPYAPEELYGKGWYTHFDAVLAMYHDQAVTPFKTIAVDDGLIDVAGLPIVTTMPDITPDFEEAGQNVVDPEVFRHAVYLAIDIFRNRAAYDEPMQNPLPRQPHNDKREEGGKGKFGMPKTHVGTDIPPKRYHGGIRSFKPKD